MNRKMQWKKVLFKSLSYVLVAVLASTATLALWGEKDTKFTELQNIINRQFIGQADMEQARDAAASAMVQALGDRWSYYISAKEYADYKENKDNAYVGVGITVVAREDNTGIDIRQVTPGGSAQESGVLPGDILVEVGGESVVGQTVNQVSELIKGEAGTTVDIGVLRNGEKKIFTLERRTIQVEVATGTLLPNNIGLVRINNFNNNCAKQTIAAIEDLRKQGADKFIFDVRYNPGGYVREMIKVLDYLLPEGVLYRDEDYRGNKGEERSDAACVDLPMAVLVNGSSYSAAEFFAACLAEYDWATVVGEKTTGKGYYQNTILLSDGSAVNLSTGKYFTPNGVNLTEAGGLTPDVMISVDDDTAAQIYSQTISPMEDPQIQGAVEILQKTQE